MLPKCSLIIYICINAFEYNAIIVYFTVLKPGTLYETWYYPSYLAWYSPSWVIAALACGAWQSFTKHRLRC